jgi:hypothetical protein
VAPDQHLLNNIKMKLKGLKVREFFSYQQFTTFSFNLNYFKALWSRFKKQSNLIEQGQIPNNPNRTYLNSGWKGWGDFLGTGNIASFNISYLSYAEAKKIIQRKKLKNWKDWRAYCRTKEFPKNIPKNPFNSYKNKGWVNLYDWLGVKKNEYLSYKETKSYLKSLNLKSWAEFKEFAKSSKRPSNIPGHPHIIYKNSGWVSINNLLGYNSKSTTRQFRSFIDAKKFVYNLKIKNQKEWQAYVKSKSKPNDIPSNPQKVYANKGWSGLSDFLGKDKTAK